MFDSSTLIANCKSKIKNLKRAFTLLELLAVMGIMMIMAAIAVSSYFGMTRGSAMRSAVSHLRSTLLLARQSAIMQGRKTYVIFGQSATNAWYVVCRHEGTATVTPDNYVMGDKYTDLSALSTNSRIYNLDTGVGSKIAEPVIYYPDTKVWAVETEDPIWTGLNKYGWEIYPKTYLPRGFQFGYGVSPATPEMIVFNADGTTRDQPYGIDIFESIHLESADPHAEITVAGLTGFISVEFE